MKRSIKLLISLAVYVWDVSSRLIFRLLGRKPLPTCVILYYHAVPASQRHLFARQMDTLLRLARPLSSTQTAGLEPGHHYAVVTFDDGFVSVKENAAPELRKRQIPWALFVPSGCLGQAPDWLRHAHPAAQHDRVMTREELCELVNDSLVTIGSHTVKHVNLLEAGADRACAELAESRAALEQILKRQVDQFSYPFGARSPGLDEQARAAGYRRLYSIAPRLCRNPSEFLTGRVNVDPDMSLLEFRLKLLGAYRWLARREHGPEITDDQKKYKPEN